MEFEVGQRIQHRVTGRSGFIHAINRRLGEVRWDDSGIKQTLPLEELRAWDKVEAPPEPKKTGWGNTTPAYLVALRREQWKNPDRNKNRELNQQYKTLADNLAGLSDKRKNRSKMKAQKLIADFHRTSQQSKYGTQTKYEAKELQKRIDRDKT